MKKQKIVVSLFLIKSATCGVQFNNLPKPKKLKYEIKCGKLWVNVQQVKGRREMRKEI